MAIGLKTWLAAAIVGCIIVTMAYLPVVSQVRDYGGRGPIVGLDSFYVDLDANPRYRALVLEHREAEASLTAARSYLRLMEQRDSLQLVVAGSDLSGNSGPIVLSVGDSPPWVIAVVRSLVAGTKNLPHDSPGVVPAVLAVEVQTVDTDSVWSGSAWWWWRSFDLSYLLPQAANAACITVVSLDVGDQDNGRELKSFLTRIFNRYNTSLFGPCAYYMAFGHPGPNVRTWLEDAGYSLALSPGWLGEPQNLERPALYRWWRLSGSVDWMRSESLPVVACAAGEAASCLEGVHAPPLPYWWLRSRDIERPPSLVRSDRYKYWHYPLGPRQPSFLSDLVLDMGSERFGRFWTSNSQLEVAFQQAFGVAIEDWTMQWARSQIGVPRRGPSAPTGSVVLSLMVGLVFVGGGAAYASRREVS
jgi:hypothetical protein